MKEEILMKKSKYSDAQIMSILKQAEGGVPVADLCREHGMSSASFYKWRSKYGGMDASLSTAEQNSATWRSKSRPLPGGRRLGKRAPK